MDRGLSRRRGVSPRGRRFVGVLVAVLAGLAAVGAGARGEPVDHAQLRHDLRNPLDLTLSWKLQPFRLPRGQLGVMFAGDDVGSAPGEVVVHGIPYPVYLIGRTLFSPPVGPGAFSAMSPLGVAGGNLNGRPAVWTPGQSPLTLAFSGAVSSIALGEVAAVNQTSVKGNRGLLWNYATGATLPVGFVHINSINAEGFAVGEADDAHAWYARVSAGRIVPHEFSWKGDLIHVDNHDWAVGFELRHGGPWPVEVNLLSDAVRTYRLPRGYRFGSALDMNDAYVSVVNAFRSQRELRAGVAVPLIYPEGPDHPVVLSSRPAVGGHGLTLSDISGISNGGILDGAATGHGSEIPVREHPLRLQFKMSVLDDIIDDEGYYDPTVSDQLLGQLELAYLAVEHAETPRACSELVNAFNLLDQEAAYLAQLTGAGVAYELSYYDDIASVLFDLGDELGCDVSQYRPLDLRPAQSPWWTLFP